MVDFDVSQTDASHLMNDPSAQAIARVYADAFVKATAKTGTENALEEYASFLNDVLNKNKEFASLLTSKVVSGSDKLQLIEKIVTPLASEIFTNFLCTLAKHDRLDLLPVVFKEARHLFETSKGEKRVQVTSARDLSDSMVENIKNTLKQKFSFEPILETRTDPSLLGGIMIQVDDTLYDSSLRTRMKQLRDRLQQRSLHEIQSGRDRFSNPEGN